MQSPEERMNEQEQQFLKELSGANRRSAQIDERKKRTKLPEQFGNRKERRRLESELRKSQKTERKRDDI